FQKCFLTSYKIQEIFSKYSLNLRYVCKYMKTSRMFPNILKIVNCFRRFKSVGSSFLKISFRKFPTVSDVLIECYELFETIQECLAIFKSVLEISGKYKYSQLKSKI